VILLIFLISIFSVLCGIILKVIIGEYDTFAFVLFGVSFGADYLTTISVKNVQSHETNVLFKIFYKRLGIRLSLLLVGLLSCVIQFIIYYITGDLLITYVLIILHTVTSCMNVYTARAISKANDIVE